MKKSIYITVYILLFSACHNDLLETVPTDRLSQSIFWQTETDAIYGANSVYRYLDGLMVKYDGLTDVLHANVQFSDAASLERGDFNSQFAMIQVISMNLYSLYPKYEELFRLSCREFF